LLFHSFRNCVCRVGALEGVLKDTDSAILLAPLVSHNSRNINDPNDARNNIHW
jgi:hypothetical protein